MHNVGGKDAQCKELAMSCPLNSLKRDKRRREAGHSKFHDAWAASLDLRSTWHCLRADDVEQYPLVMATEPVDLLKAEGGANYLLEGTCLVVSLGHIQSSLVVRIKELSPTVCVN
eukprot:GHVR01086041.1.p1 GENE.GHVR01086041.1~~GHVR01086041.1.p1  ORF type:complete len:115 (-),score=9.60 GHVR01086041.1:140-484(-)